MYKVEYKGGLIYQSTPIHSKDCLILNIKDTASKIRFSSLYGKSILSNVDLTGIGEHFSNLKKEIKPCACQRKDKV